VATVRVRTFSVAVDEALLYTSYVRQKCLNGPKIMSLSQWRSLGEHRI